jgi:hypothetical protein
LTFRESAREEKIAGKKMYIASGFSLLFLASSFLPININSSTMAIVQFIWIRGDSAVAIARQILDKMAGK